METEGPLKETEKDQTSLRYLKSFKNSSKVLQRLQFMGSQRVGLD